MTAAAGPSTSRAVLVPPPMRASLRWSRCMRTGPATTSHAQRWRSSSYSTTSKLAPMLGITPKTVPVTPTASRSAEHSTRLICGAQVVHSSGTE